LRIPDAFNELAVIAVVPCAILRNDLSSGSRSGMAGALDPPPMQEAIEERTSVHITCAVRIEYLHWICWNANYLPTNTYDGSIRAKRKCEVGNSSAERKECLLPVIRTYVCSSLAVVAKQHVNMREKLTEHITACGCNKNISHTQRNVHTTTTRLMHHFEDYICASRTCELVPFDVEPLCCVEPTRIEHRTLETVAGTKVCLHCALTIWSNEHKTCSCWLRWQSFSKERNTESLEFCAVELSFLVNPKCGDIPSDSAELSISNDCVRC